MTLLHWECSLIVARVLSQFSPGRVFCHCPEIIVLKTLTCDFFTNRKNAVNLYVLFSHKNDDTFGLTGNQSGNCTNRSVSKKHVGKLFSRTFDCRKPCWISRGVYFIN